MKDGRAADGYWGTADARRHRDVSGILILPKPHLWDLRDERWTDSAPQSLGRTTASG